jgi:NAD(P) transhydrogenase
MAPGAPVIAATCLGANTVLSFLKGYTTTAAIGGADMREYSKDENFDKHY